MRRTLPALIALAVVAGAALTGCSSSTVGASQKCDVKSGSASESVTATGGFGKTVKVSSPTPLNVKQTQATTLSEGDGKVLGTGAIATVSLSLAASQGMMSQTAGTNTQQVPTTSAAIGSGLAHALACARVGSRVAIVVPAQDAPSSLQLPEDATFIAVADIMSALPNRATGSPRPATPGFPTVVLAPNGQPGIVLGSRTAPTKAKSAVLREGDGATLKRSDQIWVQTQTVTWDDPSHASGSWEQGAPGQQALNDGSALSKALVGKKIGSQVIVLTPANGTDQASATVVDILGRIAAAPAQ